MDTQQLLSARVLMRLKIHESNGTAFETLFTTIMEYAHDDFTKIRPHGKSGDRKNDGYHPETGHYYQVYAPQNPAEKAKQATAAKKALSDFKGLRDFWQKSCPVKSYSFVFNDKYLGVAPDVEKALKGLKSTYRLKVCGCFRAKDLEAKLFTLSDDKIFVVIGNIPDPDAIQSLDYTLLNEVIAAVHERSSAITSESSLNAPKFSEKIAFNGLSEHPAALLQVASFQSGAIDQYFRENGDFAKQSLRDELNQLYLEVKASFSKRGKSDLPKGDLIFFELLNRLTPRKEKAIQDAALVVLAYYFESCDVFDAPRGAKR